MGMPLSVAAVVSVFLVILSHYGHPM